MKHWHRCRRWKDRGLPCPFQGPDHGEIAVEDDNDPFTPPFIPLPAKKVQPPKTMTTGVITPGVPFSIIAEAEAIAEEVIREQPEEVAEETAPTPVEAERQLFRPDGRQGGLQEGSQPTPGDPVGATRGETPETGFLEEGPDYYSPRKVIEKAGKEMLREVERGAKRYAGEGPDPVQYANVVSTVENASASVLGNHTLLGQSDPVAGVRRGLSVLNHA